MIQPTRRTALSMLACMAVMGLRPAMSQTSADALAEVTGMTLGAPVPFDPVLLALQARALAGKPYGPAPQVSRGWRDLTYDQFRGIWFDTRHTLFRGTKSPVQVEFFPAGLFFTSKIALNAVDAGQSRPILFEKRVFDVTDQFPDLPEEDTGFAGFRLLGELVAQDVFQEYAVFQGASYFRAISRGLGYGISARGLALKTAGDGPEEFPVFREFWIEAALPGAKSAVVHALLDSPGTTGAYKFTLTPGDTTTIDVEAKLYPRKDLAQVGIAPGTSMFLFNDMNNTAFDDFREAVHDSDGLLIHNGAGESVWRPLTNPATLQISVFADTALRGFGLMQRARDPENYNDFVADYERRPSLWVEPVGEWGEGTVMLVEIPTDKEINDNIVAFWRPAAPLTALTEHRFDYRLHWCADAPAEGTVARVTATRTGKRVFEDGRIFTVDFGAHPALGGDPTRIEARVTTSVGEIRSLLVQTNPATGGMRLDLTLLIGDGEVAELRAELWRGGQRVSEVWLYRWIAV
jgi:glucans biosynthesis protein